MKDVKLPFAHHIPSGRTVSADEVLKGNACECICLFCGIAMQARCGEKNQEHFAHQAKAVDEDNPCPASLRRCIFWMAKQVLEEGEQIQLCDYKILMNDRTANMSESLTITQAKRVPYELVFFPNITISTEYIEIDISVKGYPLKLILGETNYLPVSNKSTILIDISYLESSYGDLKRGFREAMTKAILNDTAHKHWLYHSNEDSLKNGFLAKVKEAKRATPSVDYLVRQDELVQAVHNIYNSGSRISWTCKHCLFAVSKKEFNCHYCGNGDSYTLLSLTDTVMSGLLHRFNEVESRKSLKATCKNE